MKILPTSRPSTPSTYGKLQQILGKAKAKEILDAYPGYDDISDIQPDREPTEIVEKRGTFTFVGQHEQVNLERQKKSNETNIPASLINSIGKVKNKVKEILHKKPPIAITVTKKIELENRSLRDTYKKNGIGMIFIIIIGYLLIRGK